jgi:hypothetical protein
MDPAAMARLLPARRLHHALHRQVQQDGEPRQAIVITSDATKGPGETRPLIGQMKALAGRDGTSHHDLQRASEPFLLVRTVTNVALYRVGGGAARPPERPLEVIS